MTTEQLKQNAAAMLAFAEGKPVQWANNHSEDWTDDINPSWSLKGFKYRPKPEPVSRPWNCPADVPPVCWLRSNDGGPAMLVHCVFEHGVVFADAGNNISAYWGADLSHREYSTDRKTWHPCTVTEPAQ